jgi:TPR repeat protein
MVTYAEDRSSDTQFELGELFCRGDAASRDLEQAFKWYLAAAKNGSRQAQHRLGMLYARGQGVRQSYSRSYAWCKVAAFQQSRRAKRKLKYIESKMTWEQVRRGNWLAQELYDRYVCAGRGGR